MRLRNSQRGYGAVTKLLHWFTVTAVGSQFVVGYAMNPGAASDRADDRLDELEDRGEEQAEAEGEAAEEQFEDEIDRQEDALDAREDDALGSAWSDVVSGNAWDGGLSLPEGHVLLGLLILSLALTRTVWRYTTPLPPWAPNLTDGNKRWLHASELALLITLYLVPISGLVLVLGDGDLLALHVAAHIAFFVALAAHVGVVVRRGLLPRML